MLKVMAHRGPDGEGTFFRNDGENVAFGHLRLAIIDLSTGDQPMTDREAGLTIIFNGEIYNYRELRRELEQLGATFRTASDTEVLLKAFRIWGENCLPKLRGMFAFAIWDEKKHALFLARDRFGKKPLFIHRDGKALRFASEIKSLLALPEVGRALEFNSVQDYLLFRYVPGPNTLFKGIFKLQPAHFAWFKDGRWAEKSYYRPPDAYRRPDPVQPPDLVKHFFDAVDDAVNVRMVSDVPFGVFLSGGVDSSVVAAFMTRHLSKPVRSFSIGFKERAFSETPFANVVAKHLNTDHEDVIVEARTVLEQLPAMIALSDAPVAEPGSIMMHLLSKAAAKSVKMVLTGEGADEMLGGYPKHYFERFGSHYRSVVLASIHNSLVRPAVNMLPFGMRRVKTLVNTMGLAEDRERLARWFGTFTHAERDAFLARKEATRALDGYPYDVEPGQSALRRALYFDQTQLLPDNLLERGDRMTMGASIEARMPFMDHVLMETVSAMPDSVRIRGFQQKWILRQIAKSLLPPEIAGRRKLGFSTPLRSWFRNQMAGVLFDHLTSPASRTAAFFDRQQMTKAVSEHVAGRHDNEKFLWMMLNLELFQRQFGLNG
jgi:asparagine synthase (glutamine-hydrolysing)